MRRSRGGRVNDTERARRVAVTSSTTIFTDDSKKKQQPRIVKLSPLLL